MTEPKKTSVKSKVEAVLFSTGRRASLDEMSKLCRSRKEDVIQALQDLKREYDEKQSSLMLVEEGDFWKFTVRDNFMPIIKKIVTETELSKTVLETLGVIAFKYPILQSDLIKIRTNKAYDHLTELELYGYISRQKHGRTNLIKLTDKFFKYFDLTEEKLKDKFKDFESIAKAIKEKEEEVEIIKGEQRKRVEELKKEDEKIKKEIESLDESGEEYEVPLEMYEAKNKMIVSVNNINLIRGNQKLGELEVIEEGQEGESPQNIKEHDIVEEEKKVDESFLDARQSQIKVGDQSARPKLELPERIGKTESLELNNTQKEGLDQNDVKGNDRVDELENTDNPQKRESGGIKLTSEMEARVDKRVEEILHPEKENKKK